MGVVSARRISGDDSNNLSQAFAAYDKDAGLCPMSKRYVIAPVAGENFFGVINTFRGAIF